MDWEKAVAVGSRSREQDPSAFDAASQWIAAKDPAKPVRERLQSGHRQEAEALLLAVGHLQARGACQPSEAVLSTAVFRERLWRSLGRPRAHFLRVCLAAARCGSALDVLAGESTALRELKLRVWGVCFGQSLGHALHLESVIRDHDVLILGETGTGKELIAQAIQQATLGGLDGCAAPAGAINAAAVPETLIESELFGHAKGAFTGASDARIGRIRSAHRGSFFLDEVGDLHSTTQVALLRVMETDEVLPLGSDKTHHVDVRYVAATHVDLAQRVAEGSFRQDLYERLAGNEIQLPPLRERTEDIRDMGRAFVERCVGADSEHIDWDRLDEWLDESARAARTWPGNVRELQNNLRDWILGLAPHSARRTIATTTRSSATSLPPEIEAGTATLEDLERWYFARVLAQNGGSVTKAAKSLGVNRSTAYRWLSAPGLQQHQ